MIAKLKAEAFELDQRSKEFDALYEQYNLLQKKL